MQVVSEGLVINAYLVFLSQNRRPVVYLPTKEDGTTEQGKTELEFKMVLEL